MSVRTTGAKQAGFTLVELLTVIAIIAVLSAILFPVFSRARESGRRATCLSNLGQISKAVMLYSSDYNNFLVPWSITHPGTSPWTPPSGHENTPWAGVATWDISVQSYLRNESVLCCPSNPYGRADRAYAIAQYTQKPVGGSSFGGYKDAIPYPALTVLLFEKGDNLPGSWGDALGQNVFQSHNNDYATNPDNGKMFHFDGKNFLFVDGHAKFYPAGQGPFGNKPQSGDSPGVCQTWGKPAAGGDWPME